MSAISLCIAASLGEIASRYPTSGGGESDVDVGSAGSMYPRMGRGGRCEIGRLILLSWYLNDTMFPYPFPIRCSVLLELHDVYPEIRCVDELCRRLVVLVR